MKKHIKNPKLVMAYYYEDLESDKMNADIFVCDADSEKSEDEQFQAYSKYAYGYRVSKKNLAEGDAGTYVQDEVEDSKGNKYKVILKPI